MTFDKAHSYLLTLPRFTDTPETAEKMGLERIAAVLRAMGEPHRAFKSVHVAGTNGKGSTASMLAAIFTAYGLRTGLHTSPHLLDVTERMRIDGVPAPGEWLAEAVAEWQPVFDEQGVSFFEATVALSFLYFAREGVDWAVVEVGMGGRLDATNVLSPEAVIVTHVGRDHTRWLGDTLPQIAREKADIITYHKPVCAAPAEPSVATVLEQVAAMRSAPLHSIGEEVRVAAKRMDGRSAIHAVTPDRAYVDVALGLAGAHQQENAALALRTAELLLPDGRARMRAIREGLANVARLAGLRARMECIQQEPPIIVDVAHNEDGLAATIGAVQQYYRRAEGRLILVFGVMADKDLPAMARVIRSADAEVWPVAVASERAMPLPEVKMRLQEEGVDVIGTERDVSAALDWFWAQGTVDDVLLATGSHLVAAAVLNK